MVNLKYLNYCTRYNISNSKKDIDIKYLEKNEACFGSFFRAIRGTAKEDTYEATIQLGFGYILLKKEYSNYVALTPDEFNYYMLELNKVLPFEYSLNAVKDGLYNLNIKVKASPTQIKWLLTVIRYTYEVPYSVVLKDAIVLKQSKKFSNINVLNVFNIIGSIVSRGSSWNSNHTVGSCDDGVHKLCSYLVLSNRISKEVRLESNVYDFIGKLYNGPTFSIKGSIPDDYFSKLSVYERYKTYYFPLYLWMQKQPNYIQK